MRVRQREAFMNVPLEWASTYRSGCATWLQQVSPHLNFHFPRRYARLAGVTGATAKL
jgi:hypothetical protein